ncbi:hypothetical protein LTR67_004778 [Exophiala xenobiotica]|jgi:hypothetical protein
MPFFSSNGFLAVVLIVGLGTACYSIPSLLQQVKDAARAPKPEPPPPRNRLQKDSENSLRIDTLHTLADGYSYELRNSAVKIVTSRTIHSRAKDLLLRDLTSRDYERRDNAINGLLMMLRHQSLNDRYQNLGTDFNIAKRIKATVRALVNVLPMHADHGGHEQQKRGLLPPSPILPVTRPAQEESLLVILNYMLTEEPARNVVRVGEEPAISAALKAGLVTKWLARYPFPCALPENQGYNFKRSDVARLFERMAWKTDDHLMAGIIFQVVHHPLGRKQMREAGLQASSYRENVDPDSWQSGWIAERWDHIDDASDIDNDVAMIGGEATAGRFQVIRDDDVTVWEETVPAVTRQRSVERSQEEEHLRRRHREAIVVAERGAPLRRENILQRGDSMLDVRPMHGVSEVEGDLNGLLGLSDEGLEDDQDAASEHGSHRSGEDLESAPVADE